MKHAWILNHYANLPTEKGGLTRHHSLARRLPSSGWRASIVTARTEHPSGRRRQFGTGARPETVDGVPFLFLDTPEYSGNGRDRIANMLAYGWQAVASGAMGRLDKPDVVIGSSPHPAAALAGAWLARRHRVPFVFEVRDLWPQALIDMGRITQGGAMARLLRGLERHLYHSAGRTIALWPNIGAYMREHAPDAPAPVWIPNGIDLAATPPPTPLPDGDIFTFMYLGAHGGANGLDNLVRAMRLVEDRPEAGHIRLRLIGEGPNKPELRRLAADMGLKSLSFEDAVAKQRVPQLAAEADAFVFSLIGAPMFRYGISPNKLYDYMAAERPVIFCCTAFNDPIAESGGGLSVPPGRPDLLAEAMIRLAGLPRGARAEMAAAGRSYVVAHHDFDRLAMLLAQTLDSCVEGR